MVATKHLADVARANRLAVVYAKASKKVRDYVKATDINTPAKMRRFGQLDDASWRAFVAWQKAYEWGAGSP